MVRTIAGSLTSLQVLYGNLLGWEASSGVALLRLPGSALRLVEDDTAAVRQLGLARLGVFLRLFGRFRVTMRALHFLAFFGGATPVVRFELPVKVLRVLRHKEAGFAVFHK